MVFSGLDPDNLIVEKITTKINEELLLKYPEGIDYNEKVLTDDEFKQIINKIRLTADDKKQIVDVLVLLGIVKRKNKNQLIIL